MFKWKQFQRHMRLLKTGKQLETLSFNAHPLYHPGLQRILKQMAIIDDAGVHSIDATQSMQLDQFQHECQLARKNTSATLQSVSEAIIGARMWRPLPV